MARPLQKLKDVADEFERDLYQQKLAEAEARVAEAEALRERITELEDENAGGCWCRVWCVLCCRWVLVQSVVHADDVMPYRGPTVVVGVDGQNST